MIAHEIISQPTVETIFGYIMSNGEWNKYTYIIVGKNGPTGKTSLYNRLDIEGANVIDLSGHVKQTIDFDDEENHLFYDEFSKVVLIVLNKKVK